MIQINLSQNPSQIFSIELDGVSYKIRLKTIGEFTIADVYINDALVISSVRCTPNNFLIPYKYLENGGNFFFKCVEKKYPHFSLFGKSQTLIYVNADELAEIR